MAGMDMEEDEYVGAPPRLVAMEQQVDADDAAALSLEERFAVITQELMCDEVNVAEALLAFKDACAAYTEHLRYARSAPCSHERRRMGTQTAASCAPGSTFIILRLRIAAQLLSAHGSPSWCQDGSGSPLRPPITSITLIEVIISAPQVAVTEQ